MNTFQPLNDRLLVELIHADTVRDSGIIIPDSAKEKPQMGRVVHVGEGGYLANGTFRPTQLKVGDKVLFGKFAGSLINLEGKEYLILMEDDVFGKVDA